MCSGVSIGYLLFVESANSTSPYSCSPSLGFTSSRRSIFGDIDASFLQDISLQLKPATGVPFHTSTQAPRQLSGRLNQDSWMSVIGQDGRPSLTPQPRL